MRVLSILAVFLISNLAHASMVLYCGGSSDPYHSDLKITPATKVMCRGSGTSSSDYCKYIPEAKNYSITSIGRGSVRFGTVDYGYTQYEGTSSTGQIQNVRVFDYVSYEVGGIAAVHHADIKGAWVYPNTTAPDAELREWEPYCLVTDDRYW
jgi:hypothetical protein